MNINKNLGDTTGISTHKHLLRNAGKGCNPRRVKKDKYDKNFDQINWNSKKKK